MIQEIGGGQDGATNRYANDFSEIPRALAANSTLLQTAAKLADTEPMPGKVTERGDRLARFRAILKDIINGHLSLDDAYVRTEVELDRHGSPYCDDNRTFARRWAERLVRTQYSRCYNQAVMELLISAGATECFVPHSSAGGQESSCCAEWAGRKHDVRSLYESLLRSYREEERTGEFTVPMHPYCTHTVTPVEIWAELH